MRAMPQLLLCGLVLPAAALAYEPGDDPRGWLQRMEQAVESLNYEGTFVHISEGRVETMHVVHRVEDGKVTERLVSLDGPGREIIRNEDEVTCILADRQAVLVERRKQPANPLQAALPSFSGALEAHYEFATLRAVSKLGRETAVFAIHPRDGYRYGYKLWMDKATGMLLKVQLRDQYNDIVEQLLFVSLELPDSIPESRVRPTLSSEGFTWYRQEGGAAGTGSRAASNWRAAELPPGFRLEAANTQVMAGSEAPVEHLVYTDGLASVSVFIEPEGVDEELKGASRIGAASAFTTRTGGYVVTAMGEVPERTVSMIARSVRRTGDAAVASQ